MPKRIILIRPNVPKDFPLGSLTPTVPVGLHILASCLMEAGYEVNLLDDFLEKKGSKWLAMQAEALQADFIGITVNLSTISECSEIITEVRNSNIPTVIGGPEATVNPHYIVDRCRPDFLIRGEGEETLIELLRHFWGDRRFNAVKGLTYYNNCSQYTANPSRPWISMDSIPLLNYDILPLDRYDRIQGHFRASPVEILNTSRGCPYNCAFCSNKVIWSRQYRAMSAERIIDHVKHILTNTDAKGIYFREDLFTLDRNRVHELCDLIEKQGLQFEWSCESRVDVIDEYLIERMYRAGCQSIWFGIESGSNRVLKLLNKKITAEDSEKAFELCRSAGMRVGASAMFGVPGETIDEMQQTLRLVWALQPDFLYFSAFFGLPGSELYKAIEKNPKYIYKRWNSIILPNSDYMTWPEKIKFKHEIEIKYNLILTCNQIDLNI